MAGGEPEKGDKVSWNWGGGKPGGTVTEKKSEGEIAITTKRGNTVKKNASADNPAVHVKRSGNDVVKRASELNVEKKSSGGGATNGKKREHEADGENDPLTKNAQGKEIKPLAKRQKKEDKPKEAKKDEKEEEEKKEGEEIEEKDEEEKAEKQEEDEEDEKETEKKTEKNENKQDPPKKAGRPKKGGQSKTKEKSTKPRNSEGVSSRTRSQKK